MFALVTSEVFLLFVNTFTADDKYSRRYIQTFWKQVQTPLSKKGESFFWFFIALLKCAWNLEHSENKEFSADFMQIFWQQLQTSLSQKGKTFCGFLIVFLKCAWNLQRSEKQEGYPSLIIADIIASEKYV